MFSALPVRWLALGFGLLSLALGTGNLILLAGAVYTLIIVLMGAALVAPGKIVVKRSTPRLFFWAGDELEVTREVEVGEGVGPLYVYDRLPPESDVTGGNNLRVIWKRPGPKTYDLSYRISCPKRGVYTLGETVWDAEAPLGLHQRMHGSVGPSLEISIVPRTQAIRRVNEIRGRAHSVYPQDDVATMGVSTTDFTELRPYTPGDPLRWVNWKASARNTGSDNPLMVNQYEPEGRKAVWIFMDGADYMDVGTNLSAMIDDVAEAAGSIAQYYLTRGYTLGAYIYNSQSDILTPEVGQKQFRRLTNMLTRFQPGRPNQNLLQAVEWCKGFLFRLQPEVYTITRLDVHYPRGAGESPYLEGFLAGIRRLVALRPRSRRSNQIRVVHLEPGGYQRAQTPLETQAKGLMRWESQTLYGTLGRSGASVLRWDPKQQDFASTLLRHINTGR